MTRQTHAKSGLFLYLLFCTAVFLLLEFSFFLQGSGLYLGDFQHLSHRVTLPVTILPGILFYLMVLLVLHLLFTVFVWGAARLIGVLFRLEWSTTQALGFYLWGIALLTVLLANAHYYPNSKYADLVCTLCGTALVTAFYWIGFTVCSMVLALAAVSGVIQLYRVSEKMLVAFVMGWVALFTVTFFHHETIRLPETNVATAARPNIILLGVDSLRPDYIGYLGSDLVTPTLDAFLQQSTVFMETITPIARTFPAWVSLLTGQYPKVTGARFDLRDIRELSLGQTLPAILQAAGYETIFATDETRFSNITQAFGFDDIVTPPTGLNDFLLGTFNDFPLTNLLVNTRWGQWLLPYSFGNRPAFATYEPSSFLRLLQPRLTAPHPKPLFLAIHLCLPHYPYYWADYRTTNHTDAVSRYQASIQRIDRALADILAALQQQHLLDHSIVVLLSDHGEALELPGDRVTARNLFIPGQTNVAKQIPHFYPPSLDDEAVDESVGHGTDILSLSQYHAVMAFRLTGVGDVKPHWVSGLVSLMDIKPTLLDWLGLTMTAMNGRSLRTAIEQQTTVAAPEHLFIESDFSPQAIHTAHPETRQILFDTIDFFDIHPQTTRLTVKPGMASLIISSKQYADIQGSWMLALYPQGPEAMTPILVNLVTGQWTNDLRTSFAEQSPAANMLQALRSFYGPEIRFVLHV